MDSRTINMQDTSRDFKLGDALLRATGSIKEALSLPLVISTKGS